jgi:hypothetical protein
MYIQGYQIHNVLNVFRRQLSQSNSDQSRYAGGPASDLEAVTISTRGKKQAIMEKVAARVFKKITDIEPGSDLDRQTGQPDLPVEQELCSIQMDNEFVFCSIVGNNRKETRSIAIDSSQGLMNQLDELAKAAVKRNTGEAVGETHRNLASLKGRFHQER